MLPNAYFVAKFRFDIAENEPAKNLQNVAKFCQFRGMKSHLGVPLRGVDEDEDAALRGVPDPKLGQRIAPPFIAAGLDACTGERP